MNMRNQGLISIIMPAYNAEKTIKQTIDVILNQTYSNIELLVINDGSTDSTLSICESINDKRLRVITIENQGQGVARNIGIENSTGEFIGFCDSDDQMAVDMYENLYRMITDTSSDMVGCGHSDIINGHLMERKSGIIRMLDRIQALDDFAFARSIKWGVWDKLFRADKILQIRFPEERLHAEDCQFILEFIMNNSQFYIEDLGKYYYRRDNSESYTKRKWSPAKLGLTYFYRNLLTVLRRTDLQEATKYIEKRYHYNLISTQVRLHRYNYKSYGYEIQRYMKEEKENVMRGPFPFYMKIDFLLCSKFPRLSHCVNIWYK